MGKSNRDRQLARSRSPRMIDPGPNGSIPEIFRPRAPSQDDRAQAPASILEVSREAAPYRRSHRDPSPPQAAAAICLDDLRAVAADIKNTLSAAIADLRMDLQTIAVRLEDVEDMTDHHALALQHTDQTLGEHAQQLRELHRNIEDLENRGRRHNIRIRGLPETVELEHVDNAVLCILNDLLGRPSASPIEFERLHRALKPRGRETDPPRDVIGCLVDYKLKEEIMRQARLRGRLMYQGQEVKLYQDLSHITLQKRRALRPLLDVLRDRNIPYRWKFPFCLQAGSGTRIAHLRHPEDLREFCAVLNLPLPNLPDWHLSPQLPRQNQATAMEVQDREDQLIHRRRRFSPGPGAPGPRRSSTGGGSVPASPAHRRARRD